MLTMQDYRIWLVERADDLAALRQPWTAMLAEAGQVSVFLTWEWVYTCWQHGAPPGRLWLLTAWDRDDELAGVAPLVMGEERQGPLHIRRLAFIGGRSGSPAYQEFPTRGWDRRAVLAALVSYLLNNGEDWDVLDLEGLAAASPLASCLAGGPGRLLACDGVPAPRITLPPTWEAFAAQQLSPRQRLQLQHWQGQLATAYPGQVLFRRVTEACELPAALAQVAAFPDDLPARGATATAPAPRREAALEQTFAELALRHSWLYLYLMEIAGHTAAVACNFLYRGVFTSFCQGCSPAWTGFHAGALLRAHIVQQAITLGARQFDLLPGFGSHYAAWTADQRREQRLMLSAGWPGHAWLWRSAALAAARHIVAAL